MHGVNEMLLAVSIYLGKMSVHMNKHHWVYGIHTIIGVVRLFYTRMRRIITDRRTVRSSVDFAALLLPLTFICTFLQVHFTLLLDLKSCCSSFVYALR